MLRCNAAVQELTAATWSARQALVGGEISLSNCATLGPVPSQPDRKLSMTSAISSSRMSGAPNTKKFSSPVFLVIVPLVNQSLITNKARFFVCFMLPELRFGSHCGAISLALRQ